MNLLLNFRIKNAIFNAKDYGLKVSDYTVIRSFAICVWKNKLFKRNYITADMLKNVGYNSMCLEELQTLRLIDTKVGVTGIRKDNEEWDYYKPNCKNKYELTELGKAILSPFPRMTPWLALFISLITLIVNTIALFV